MFWILFFFSCPVVLFTKLLSGSVWDDVAAWYEHICPFWPEENPNGSNHGQHICVFGCGCSICLVWTYFTGFNDLKQTKVHKHYKMVSYWQKLCTHTHTHTLQTEKPWPERTMKGSRGRCIGAANISSLSLSYPVCACVCATMRACVCVHQCTCLLLRSTGHHSNKQLSPQVSCH